MDFRLLGPLEAADGAAPVDLPAGKPRALLALLLLNAGRAVPRERLVDDLWGEDAPESAHKMIQIYVSHLRKTLPERMLQTRAPGYLVDLAGHTLDVSRFEKLLAGGRASLARGRARDAAGTLREALALWRGRALGEFAEPFAELESARLEELRLACLEERIDADLALGRHAELVPELDALVRRHPHRERVRAQLMLALYRSGRHGEALDAYRRFRRLLDEELGIDPPPRLKELERRILRQDPALDAAAPPAAADDAGAEGGAHAELRSGDPAGVAAAAVDAGAEATAPPSTSACPSCGTHAPAGSRFCASCGAPLAEAAAPDRMLKLVTVLFVDVAGSTARAEALHPEDVHALMADFFGAMAREIEAEGGTIEKVVGGAIMAVFGVPAAHEDDAVRAVRAARRMLERLRRWNDEREPAERLDIRIGVDTGGVLTSGAAGADLLVTGDAVNVAARLQQAAEPETIVVGDRTARAARSHFELRPIPPLLLKGKSEPIPAWLVGAERPAAARRGPPGLGAPLVGRTHELASLRTTLARVRAEGRPELVTLVGDAGIGKSRLVREFVEPLEAKAKVLVGRCLPYAQGVTLSPLAEMLKAEAEVLDSDPAAAASAKIARFVETAIDRDLAGERPRTAAALGATLGLRTPGDPLGALDPRDLYRELVSAWRALLASLGRHAPVVAVVEDLHWADPTMLDVLDELAERLDGPILFVCTARPDLLRVRPDWGGGRRGFGSLPVDPLSDAESARLVAFLLDAELPEGVRRPILERSEGNPFFLEEVVHHLIDGGVLVPENGRWRPRGASADVEIPDSVHGVILARLDLLTPEERRVAQRAAVVGRVFWDGAVAGLAGVEDLDGALRTLRRREFVLERLSSSIAGQTEYVFKHVLIRDVAYESLPRKERGRAHAGAAEWIESTSGDTGETAELLARHYDAAYTYLRDDELRRRARWQLLAAAANAHRRFALAQGESFARRAVELSVAAGERVEALEALGDLNFLDGDGAWRAYGEALGELSDGDPALARLAGKAALFGARWIGTMQELPTAEEVRGVIEGGLRAAPGEGRDRTLLLLARGFLLSYRENRHDAAAAAAVRDALEATERLGDADLLSGALDLVQSHEGGSGRYGEAYRATLTRCDLVPRMTDVREIGDAYAVAARTALHVGRYRDAEAYATSCVERARGIDAGSYAHGLTWRVPARFALGDWDGALADQAELERVAAQDPRDVPAGFTMRAYTCTALCHELRGERREADRYVELAMRYLHRRRGLHTGSSIHAPPVALALARRGRFDEALELIPLAPRSGSAAVTLEALCELAGARERWDEAAEVAAAARAEAAAGELLSLPLYADRVEGRAAAARGETARAADLLGRSAEGFAALGARWEEAWSRLLLAEAIAGSERGRAEREVASSLPVFDGLRSVAEAARARELLAQVAV